MINDAAASGPNSGFLSSSNIGGFGYGIGISVGILLLITTITLTSYFCSNRGQQQQQQQQPQRNTRRHRDQSNDEDDVIIDVGLDEETVKSYPMLLYSETKIHKKDSTSTAATCCSICLADYKSCDMLRVLPDCNHMFHVKCVDKWLRLHATCPVCRTSPIPTPLAEVVPLASRRD